MQLPENKSSQYDDFSLLLLNSDILLFIQFVFSLSVEYSSSLDSWSINNNKILEDS